MYDKVIRKWVKKKTRKEKSGKGKKKKICQKRKKENHKF